MKQGDGLDRVMFNDELIDDITAERTRKSKVQDRNGIKYSKVTFGSTTQGVLSLPDTESDDHDCFAAIKFMKEMQSLGYVMTSQPLSLLA